MKIIKFIYLKYSFFLFSICDHYYYIEQYYFLFNKIYFIRKNAFKGCWQTKFFLKKYKLYKAVLILLKE